MKDTLMQLFCYWGKQTSNVPRMRTACLVWELLKLDVWTVPHFLSSLGSHVWARSGGSGAKFQPTAPVSCMSQEIVPSCHGKPNQNQNMKCPDGYTIWPLQGPGAENHCSKGLSTAKLGQILGGNMGGPLRHKSTSLGSHALHRPHYAIRCPKFRHINAKTKKVQVVTISQCRSMGGFLTELDLGHKPN